MRFIAFSNRNLIPSQRKVLEAIQDELSYGKGREITTIQAIYDRLGMFVVFFVQLILYFPTFQIRRSSALQIFVVYVRNYQLVGYCY